MEDEATFLKKKIDKFRTLVPGNFIDPDWFAHISLVAHNNFYDTGGIYLRRPLQGEYGEFLAICKLFFDLKFCIGSVVFNPIKLLRRNSFYILPPRFAEDTDITDLYCFGLHDNLKDKQNISFSYGKFLLDMSDSRWVAMLPRVSEFGQTYSMEFPGVEEERIEEVYKMRMDLHNWDQDYCLTKHIFSVPGESIEGAWMNLQKEYKTFAEMNLVKDDDPESICKYLFSKNNLNYIDLTDNQVTIESNMIQKWLNTLSPTSYDDPIFAKKIGAAILLINRVVAQNIRCSSGSYYAKTRIINLEGMPDCEIKSYNPDGIKRITASWNFTIPKKDDNNPEIKFWIDYWKRSEKRARITSLIFRPWSIMKPETLVQGDGKEYMTNRVVNTFSGYMWTWDDLKEAFMDPGYSNTVRDFETVISKGFCSDNRAWTEYFLNWLAWIIQFPSEKTQVAVIVKTKKGIGKGWTARLLELLFGKNFLFVPGRGLDDQFNSHLADRTLVFIDELNPQSFGKSNIDIIKSIVTERNTLVHKKFEDQRVDVNRANFIAATNNEVDLELTPDNRRFVIFEGTSVWTVDEIKRWKPFIERMWSDFITGPECEKNRWLKARSVFYHLASKDLKGFVPYKDIPVTDYMKKLMERSIPVEHNWWRFIVSRRQISDRETPGSDPTHLKWKWYDLFLEFKKNDEFSKLYDTHKKKASKLAQQDFKISVSEVLAIVQERGSEEFKFSCWQDQISKWNSLYPYSMIEASLEEPANPFLASKIKEMKDICIDDDIKDMNAEEMRAALQLIRSELEEEKGIYISLNSFGKRRPSDNSDLVVFESRSNKKRKV